MKSAAVLNFGASGAAAGVACAVLGVTFVHALLVVTLLVHLFLYYAEPGRPQAQMEFKGSVQTGLTRVEVKPDSVTTTASLQTSLRESPAKVLVDEFSQHVAEFPPIDCDIQTVMAAGVSCEMQTSIKHFQDIASQHVAPLHPEIGVQSSVAVVSVPVQSESPALLRNVSVQTTSESVHRSTQFSPLQEDESTAIDFALDIELLPVVNIQGREEYIMVENEESESQHVREPEVAAEIREEAKGSSEFSQTQLDRIFNEIQASLHQEHDGPEAKVVYVNPIAQGQGTIINSVMLSSSTSMQDRALYGFFLCLSERKPDDYFGVLPFEEGNVDVYPVYPQASGQSKDEATLSTWMLCSQMSDYIVLILDLKNYPELQYSELLYKLFEYLQKHDKPMFIFHAVSPEFSFQDSSRKLNELIELYYHTDNILTHFELAQDLRTNVDIVQSIREQMGDHLRSETFETRYKAALDATLNELFVLVTTRNKEMAFDENDISLQQLGEGWHASVQLEAGWKCTIREQYVKIVPDTQVLISPLRYFVDERLSCQVKVAALQDASLMRCAVFSNLSTLTFKQLNVISSFMVKDENKSLLILPYDVPWLRGSSNHINSPQFDNLFVGQFMRVLANCLILSLYYERGDLVQPEDKFKTLGAVIRAHYQEGELRGTKKPILIIHNLNVEGDLEDIYSAFKNCLRRCTRLMSRWRAARSPSRVRTHKHTSEGCYAFDDEGQVIHRLVVTKPPNIGWVLYNQVLFKLMHDAVAGEPRGPLSVDVSVAFRETVEKLIDIRDEEDKPHFEHICDEGRVVSSPVTESQVLDYILPLQPSWTISTLQENAMEDVSVSAEIV